MRSNSPKKAMALLLCAALTLGIIPFQMSVLAAEPITPPVDALVTQGEGVSIALLAGSYTVRGTVVDNNTDTGLYSPLVRLMQSDEQIGSKFCDTNGGFSFSGVPDGNYTLVVGAGTYGSGAGKAYNAASVNITVNGGDVTQNIRLTLATGTYTISGTVRDATSHQTLSAGYVRLYRESELIGIVEIQDVGSHGKFILSGIPNGDYTIVMNAGIY
ncbi:MAG: carboxypeptidase-like regulatory domain-containing protein, partial [Oscillospiraceae bacterium]|nr:carboxypeptidase-like regulatory domain-containing protein [Oscillospiraceae bacterium]